MVFGGLKNTTRRKVPGGIPDPSSAEMTDPVIVEGALSAAEFIELRKMMGSPPVGRRSAGGFRGSGQSADR
jgi:hypothetical protein